MAEAPAALRPFDGRSIPDLLKGQNRWAPWIAIWDEKRQKYDKVPRRADVPEYGLSTADPSRWYTYAAALATYRRESPPLAGVGYVMTGAHGIVGVDLDGCIADGQLAPWAQEVVDELHSYTEVSPSGRGLRIFLQGEAADWMNHTVGIEVYGGSAPRFLTITGAHLVGTPLEVVPAPAGALEGLRARYGAAAKAAVDTGDMPDLLDELMLPDVAGLDLPYAVRDFLESGEAGSDRSRTLHVAGVALYAAGLADDEVLSVLAANPFAMEVALDHRGQDTDRALLYLWREHCAKARGKASSRIATADDFDVVAPEAGAAPAAAPAPKGPRFAFSRAADLKMTPVSWAVRRVLPQAELGVIYGASGAGKSFLALDLCMAVATGTEWRGLRAKKGVVAYIVAEGAGGFRMRIRAHTEHYGIDVDDLDLHVLCDAPNFLEKTDVRDLTAALRRIPGLTLVVVDTLAQVTPGANENSGEDMGRALAHCKAIHKATSAMVVLVAHAGKDTDKGIRGWSGIKGALDVEISVERADMLRAATITKMKDGEGEGDEYPFTLDVVTMGQDEDGEAITSCVVKPGSVVPRAERKTEPKGTWEKLLLRTARELLEFDETLTINQLLDATVSQMPAPAKGKDRRSFLAGRALESLIAASRIANSGGLVVLL